MCLTLKTAHAWSEFYQTNCASYGVGLCTIMHLLWCGVAQNMSHVLSDISRPEPSQAAGNRQEGASRLQTSAEWHKYRSRD